MAKTHSILALLAAATFACSALHAEQTPRPILVGLSGDSASERINFSGKLRMLSQRIASAACNVHADVEPQVSLQMLSAAHAEFSKIVDALEFGDVDLHIAEGESRATVLAALNALRAEWQPLDAAAKRMIARNHTAADIDLINTRNQELLSQAVALVDSILSEYSDTGAGDETRATMINMAGRQRMLTQKISKEACQIWSGNTSPEATSRLTETITLFEAALESLRFGNEAAGVPKAPSPAIENGLLSVAAQIADIRQDLAQAEAGKAAPPETRARVLRTLTAALRDMNAVVGLYSSLEDRRGLVEDTGATERINFSGKLRMLSQRIAATACYHHAGVEPDLTRDVLFAAQAEFQKIISALEFGDADLRIRGAEERRKTLFAIQQLKDRWQPISDAVDIILSQGPTESALKVILEQNMALLDSAKLLVSELSGQYSDPTAMLQSDAMLVDISGRQRMLTQKMSKEACEIWSGFGDEDRREALSGTMQMFEISLTALREGLPSAGIKAAPTPEIAGSLDVVVENWTAVKTILQNAQPATPESPQVQGSTFKGLNKTMANMNKAVGLYTEHAKAGL